jgi:hypothetical protein
VSPGQVIVIALRLIVPLSIFRYPLAGGVISMLLDGADVILVDLLSSGGFGSHYAQLDKGLDTYYLGIELLVALSWESLYAKLPAIALFAYRMVGVIAFELTSTRLLLFIFPNLFENWWLYCVATLTLWPRFYPRTWKTVGVVLVLLLIPKMGQEYLLHYTEAKPWEWTKRHVLRV